MILDSNVKYFVPWRAVWNEGSVTHACRMVFDGSQAMIVGKAVTAGLKLDVSNLHQGMLDWDNTIPNELKNTWIKNFDLKELTTLKF